MPAFPALAAFVASIVGYPMPVVCQPLPQGTSLSYQVSGSFGTASLTSSPLPEDLAGVTLNLGVPIGDVLTITIGGQTVTLPPAPPDTPSTDEQVGQPGQLPGGRVYVPVFIALANCEGWTSDDPGLRGRALITAIHEAMHAKFADGNEALTECRALQALPTQLAALWPGVTNPGAEPDQPALPARSTRWRKLHPALWRKLLASYRAAYARWLPVDRQWQQSNDEWGIYQRVLGGASDMDAEQPPQYHGATC